MSLPQSPVVTRFWSNDVPGPSVNLGSYLSWWSPLGPSLSSWSHLYWIFERSDERFVLKCRKKCGAVSPDLVARDFLAAAESGPESTLLLTSYFHRKQSYNWFHQGNIEAFHV